MLTPHVSLSQTYHRHPSTPLSSSLEVMGAAIVIHPPALSFLAVLGPGLRGFTESPKRLQV